jgi:6,7-dimethyl-8-ribityllumazine synthase
MARYDNINEIQPNIDGKGLRIGIAMSRFNMEVCEGLLSAAVAALVKAGVSEKDVVIATAPGALELPLILKKMAESGKFDGLVALGAVIRGDTYHFEIVSNEMAAGITRATLDSGVPIANGVLTTNTDHQATSRMTEKGREAALCAIEMARLLKAL